MKKYVIWISIVYLLITMITGQSAGATIDNRAEILILHSYSPDYEWTRNVQLGIEKVLDPQQHRIHTEYMDANNISPVIEKSLVIPLYKEKFAKAHFKMIIAADNIAFNFLRLYRDELFPGVPVVFCGVNNYTDSMIEGLENFTGIAEDNDFLGLFNLIGQLHPSGKQIVIYADPNDSSQNITLIKEQLLNFQFPYEILIREVSTLESCISDAKKLPENSIIFIASSMYTASGEWVDLQQTNELMSAAVSLPIYTAWDFGVGHGAIGGRVISAIDHGGQAGNIALRLLNERPLPQVAVSRYLGNIYMFDYNQLARFGLKITQLPLNSVVINVPSTTYQIDKNFIWMGISCLVILVSAVLILIINIRKRKKAEVALVSSQEKFAKAFQYCADIIGITKLDTGQYIEVSEAFYDILGYNPEDLRGRFATTIEKKASKDENFQLWVMETERNELVKTLKKDRCIRKFETHWYAKSGEIKIGLYSAEIIELGGESYILYTWHDITSRKLAEETLQQAHKNLEIKIESRTHELSSLNEELSAMNEELQCTNWELENEVTERRQIELELSRTNQKLTASMSEQQAMQAYLVESAKMASLGKLVAGIAHEINTPIGISLTATSHLQELTKQFGDLCTNGNPRRQSLADYLSELHECSTMILRNLERAGKLIQSFKKVSTDQSSEIKTIFNVKQYLEEIILSMQPELRRNNHHIVLQCDPDLMLQGFPGAFSQIITNLIMNSIIHAYDPGENGKIQITATMENAQIVLHYSDDGKGMAADIVAKIFDPFYTTKRWYGGTGLGMHLVYNIVVQQFKGTIHCDSQPEQGATFLIKLPFSKENL